MVGLGHNKHQSNPNGTESKQARFGKKCKFDHMPSGTVFVVG